MKYWLHRISYLMNVSYPLLDKNYLSIGFSDFCNKDFLYSINESSYNDAWKILEDEFQTQWSVIPRRRYFLWNFLREMKKGDYVIVPSWGTFSVYELLDDSAILANSDIIDLPNADWNGIGIVHEPEFNMLQLQGDNTYLDLGFFRRVKLICKDIPRSDYADSRLTSRMKIRCTNADISDLKNSVDKAIELFMKQKPINIKADLIDETVDIWKSVIKKDLNADKFERLVKWYFVKIGASRVDIVQKNYAGKQGDADVISTFEKLKTIIYVQVKFHDGETSDWAVQQIKDFSESKEGMSDDYYSQFWVISSADGFSDKCIKLARENNIRLINGVQFVKMLLNVGIDTLEEFDS